MLRRDLAGISKISVQTGTSHGGVVRLVKLIGLARAREKLATKGGNLFVFNDVSQSGGASPSGGVRIPGISDFEFEQLGDLAGAAKRGFHLGGPGRSPLHPFGEGRDLAVVPVVGVRPVDVEGAGVVAALFAALPDFRMEKVSSVEDGDTFDHTFATAGVFDYFCTVHPVEMTGQVIVLEPGQSVLLHSDGLAEAHSPGGEMFGFPRLQPSRKQPLLIKRQGAKTQRNAKIREEFLWEPSRRFAPSR